MNDKGMNRKGAKNAETRKRISLRALRLCGKKVVAVSVLVLIALLPFSFAGAQGPDSKMSTQLARELQEGPAEFLVILARQADLGGAAQLPGRVAKGEWVARQLQQTARIEQSGLRMLLDRQGVSYRSLWIVNGLVVRGDAALARRLGERPEVARLIANPTLHLRIPEPDAQTSGLASPSVAENIEWHVSRVRAPEVWARYGVRGEGVVVADNDTGVKWDHEALKQQYRGWDAEAGAANHDYAWHDAFGEYSAPYDDHGHGTHVDGIMVGDNVAVAGEGASRRQTGVAPEAEWIGCRNMSGGVGSPASYLDCFQWLLAPTRADGTQPRPELAPDIINNSWACTPGEGCTDDQLDVLREAAANVRAAGIFNVVAAGNEGNAQCGTVISPPAIYPELFAVGATDESNRLAGFSSIGPVLRDGSDRFKPDLVAPGQSVQSSTAGSTSSYGYLSGTSMAAPGVSGVAALMLDAAPQLSGDVALIERLLRETAQPITEERTVGHPDDACAADASEHPNLLYGWGLVDALAAVEIARTCPIADFSGDGAVDIQDLARQATAWDQPAGGSAAEFDLNADGTIDETDLRMASEQWKTGCLFPSG